MSAPTPFEVWQAGMFTGLVLGSQGRDVRSFDASEIQDLFCDWLIERSAIGSEVVASPPRVAASDRVAEPRAKSAIEQDAPPP